MPRKYLASKECTHLHEVFGCVDLHLNGQKVVGASSWNNQGWTGQLHSKYLHTCPSPYMHLERNLVGNPARRKNIWHRLRNCRFCNLYMSVWLLLEKDLLHLHALALLPTTCAFLF